MEELEIKEAEFSLSSQEAEILSEGQEALVGYVTKSKAPFKLDTLIPRNMAFEVQKAMNRLVQSKGNIDNYLRDQLKYPSIEQMWKGLAAEQVDSLALYLSQFEKEQGIIIGDQTGIGKGRQAAGVIRHAILNGYLPIFFTKKTDLFTDIYRDLLAIGQEEISPFILNTDTGAKVKDANGHIIFTPLNSKEQRELLTTEREVPTESPEGMEWFKKLNKPIPDPEIQPTVTITDVADQLPFGYDAIFCTYSQIQAAHPYKRLWLAQLINGGIEGSKSYKKVVLVLDESHMAGGFDSIVGQWIRAVLPQSKAACFLSATFAKYPEVMPLYAEKTAIKESGLEESGLVRSMITGGLPLQEIIASDLAASGQLIRRQRSNEGIQVNYLTLNDEPAYSKHRKSVDQIISIMQQVVQFEEDYLRPVLDQYHAEARQAGEHLKKKPASLGVKTAPYFSRVFNIIDQMLFALKVEEVAKQTIAFLAQNKKVVIAFKSTMGAFLKDLNLTSGDRLEPDQLDFSSTLVKGLDGLFKYNYTDINNEKTRRSIPLEELSELGRKEYHRLKELMAEEKSGLSITPIDELMHQIQSKRKPKGLGGHDGDYYKVAEVTGRNQRIRYEEDEAIVEAFKTDGEQFFRQFNSGDYDVLLINQTGSTGASAHASKDFKDQRARAMIIHQFELDINTEIQKRGRINRTGQVVLPEYLYVTSAIPLEQRLMTMLKAKLKSLDANTTGSQKTNDKTLESPDFMNKYGDRVAWQWIDDHPSLAERMGRPTFHKVVDRYGHVSWERNEGKEGAIRQLTGRAGLLFVAEQDQLYEDLLNAYEYEIKFEKQQGTYDLETEFLKLDAEVKKRFLFQKGTGGKTPFGRDTVREINVVNNLKRPLTKAQIDGVLKEKLQGKKAVQVQTELINQVNEDYPKLIEKRRAKRQLVIQELQKELDTLPGITSELSDKEREKLARQRARLEELISEKKESLEYHILGLGSIKHSITKHMGIWNLGDIVKVPSRTSLNEFVWGIFLGVNIRKAKNPYTLGNITLRFAVADSRAIIEYNLTSEQQQQIHLIDYNSKEITSEEIKTVNQDWNTLIAEASHKREKRHVLTENIVSASGNITGTNRLIKYNTSEGTIKNGILLHKSYGQGEGEGSALLSFSSAQGIIEGLASDGVFGDHRNQVRIKKVSDSGYQVFLSKAGNFKLYTDEVLRTCIMRAEGQSLDELPDFVQNAGEMTGALHQNKLEKFLKRLDELGMQYYGEARELEDWEVENQRDWESTTQKKEGSFKYELSKAYGQGSNPTINFKGYEEPDNSFPFGWVEYTEALSDQEKFNYSLIPIYKNPEEPYLIWKKATEKSSVRDKFKQLLASANPKYIGKTIDELGYFIFNHAHEDGNAEFVFGKYTAQELGRAAYQDQWGRIAPIDELIEQLTLLLDETI